jgi:signal transduction histidine kinase/ligand-binding sensor domain-containing protein
VNRLLPLFVLLLVLTGFSKLRAQPYYFRHYQVENGLSNNTVFCSMQDNNGFMWFGTKEGLNRFDGYRFKLFKLGNTDEHNLQKDFIYCLFTDTKGRFWVGTQKGLFQFDTTQEKLVHFFDSLPEVGSIQMDLQERLWFLSGSTICRYDLKKNVLKTFPTSRYFDAYSMCMDSAGGMWFSTWNGILNQFDAAAETFKAHDLFVHSERMPTCFIKKMYPAGKGQLFVGTSCQGIKLFDIPTGTYTDIQMYSEDQTTIYVRDIIQYAEHEFWFATESGIYIYNTNTRRFINLKKKILDPYSLSDNAVYTLCKDKEGGVWAGTYFGGLNYYPKQYTPFQKFYPDGTINTISGGAVREICEDQQGNLWIGTEDAGLTKLNRQNGIITHFKPSGKASDLAYHNIHGLMAYGNQLWVGTFDHGLDILDINTGKVIKHYTAGDKRNGFKNDFIVTILQTRSGEVYMGTSMGLYRYRRVTDDFELIKGLPEYEFIPCLTEDHAGIIWIGSRKHGALFYDPATKKSGQFSHDPNNENSVSMNDLNAILEDRQHNIWIATEGGGVCRLDESRKNIKRYTTNNGLPSNFTFKVVEDNAGMIWITSSKGLVKLNPHNDSTVLYTKADGILYDQFNYNSGYKDATGRLYFGSIKGMITFRPDSLTANHFIPPVYITGFQVHNKELEIDPKRSPLHTSILYAKEITLPYDASSFSIDFAALGYATPDITEYRYKMDKLEKEWTYLGSNRKVYFTNISPGTYVFRLAAAANGHWGQEKQLQIKILPPFWATNWARLFYALIVIGICYLLVRNYHKRQKVKKEKEIYEAKIDFFTHVAHEIRTPLTLIKGPLENLSEQVTAIPQIKEDVMMMDRNTNRLMALAAQILDFRQTEAKGFSLDFTKVNITGLLQEVYLNFQPLAKKKDLKYTIDLPVTTVTAIADEDALQKIFSNLFSNAVKYAEKNVTIQLHPVKKEDTLFTIEIANDGPLIPAAMKERIFEPFFRIKETMKQKGTGIGLALTRSLVQLHQGNIYLKDEPGATMNTFVLSLPLQPDESKKRKKLL